jgi:hypothetical protein
MPRKNLSPIANDPLPPAEVRFLEVRLEPWPDGQRVRVHVTLTPFQNRPNLVAKIFDSQKHLLSQADIIETMDDRLVFTMHLRADDPPGPFRLEISLHYEDTGQIDQRGVDFSIDVPQN